MCAYPSVLLPALYYSISFSYASVLFAVTGSYAFSTIYGFSPSQVGLCIGFGTFVGTVIGELTAGPVSDRILYHKAKKNNGVPIPESRLQAMWPALVLLPAGVIIEGVCFQNKTHWIGPCVGMATANFGLQVASTNIYAYMTDVSIEVRSCEQWLTNPPVLQTAICRNLDLAQLRSPNILIPARLLCFAVCKSHIVWDRLGCAGND